MLRPGRDSNDGADVGAVFALKCKPNRLINPPIGSPIGYNIANHIAQVRESTSSRNLSVRCEIRWRFLSNRALCTSSRTLAACFFATKPCVGASASKKHEKSWPVTRERDPHGAKDASRVWGQPRQVESIGGGHSLGCRGCV